MQTVSMKENRDFRRLYYRGKNAATPYLVLYAAKNRRKYNRLGITVSKKLGGAVQRNRAKRLLREAYRLQEHELLHGYDLVLVARVRLVSAHCRDAQHALRRATAALGLREKAGKK